MAAQDRAGEERGIRILCLDGAGMRNISQLPFIDAIESIGNGKKLHEMFDLICGSGFGGLLAIAIGINQRGQDDCRRLLHDLSSLFHASSLNLTSWYRWMLGRGFYDTSAFKQCLNRHLGDLPWQTLGWLNPKVCVVSGNTHLNGRTTPCLWRTYSVPNGNNNNTSNGNKEAVPGFNTCGTVQAAHATASLPGCFCPFSLTHGPDRLQFVDGATVAPNPTEYAIFEANKIWPGRPIDIVVSLGTGVSIHPLAKPPVLRHGLGATDIEEAAARIHDTVSRWAEISKYIHCYVRLDPPISKHVSLTEQDLAALDAVEQRTKAFLDLEANEDLQRLRLAFVESSDT